MPRRPHMTPPEFNPARPGLVRPVPIDRKGDLGPTRAQARGPGWRRTSWGFYVPAGTDGDSTDQRIVEAGHHLGPNAAITGWAALRWWGATYIDGLARDGKTKLPVQITSIRRGVRPQDGRAVTGECIPPGWRTVVDGLRVVSPVVAVAYEMRYAGDVSTAVRYFDMAARDDLVSTEELNAHFELLYHWIGIPRARTARDLVDENAWSPYEVDVRLVWPIDLGLSAPLANRPIFSLDGRHLGTPDLLDEAAGLAVEFEGGAHLVSVVRANDLVRADDFRRVGLEVLELVGADVMDHARLVRRIQEARRRALAARAVAAGPPRWTLRAPPWWIHTHTVERRRALTPDQAERLLRYRLPGSRRAA